MLTKFSYRPKTTDEWVKVPVRRLPWPVKTYGPSFINALIEIPKEYVGDTKIQTYYNIVFKQVWFNVLQHYPDAEITGESRDGSKWIYFVKKSTDPTASYERAMIDINIWVTHENQILIELIILTGDTISYNIFKTEIMNGIENYTTFDILKNVR